MYTECLKDWYEKGRTPDTNKDKIDRALDNFKDAFVELNRVWDLEGNDKIIFDANYPFHKDFQELTNDILDWTNECKENCRKCE